MHGSKAIADGCTAADRPYTALDKDAFKTG